MSKKQKPVSDITAEIEAAIRLITKWHPKAEVGIRAVIARVESSDKPKWRERKKHEELRNLTAPQFLKHAHASEIHDNIVYKEKIRAYDPELMEAVESYISQRKRRGLDLGDASGLSFVISRPARNTISREVTYRKLFGRKNAKKFVEAVRETDRTRARTRRSRRAQQRQP